MSEKGYGDKTHLEHSESALTPQDDSPGASRTVSMGRHPKPIT